MRKTEDWRSLLPGTTARGLRAPGPAAWMATSASLFAFLVLAWLLLAPSLAAAPSSTWGAASGWDLRSHSAFLLAAVSALPLVLLPAWAQTPNGRWAGTWFSAAMLALYGLSLSVGGLKGWVTEPALGVYFLGLAATIVSIALAARWWTAGGTLPVVRGPRFKGSGSILLLGGAMLCVLPVWGVLSVPTLVLGVAAMLAGALWAGPSKGMHPLAPCRRTLVAAIAAGSGLTLFAAAMVHWCFADPLAYTILPVALLGVISALAPPHATESGSLAVPPGAYEPRAGIAWAWGRALAGIVSTLLLVLGAVLASGWLPTAWCL